MKSALLALMLVLGITFSCPGLQAQTGKSEALEALGYSGGILLYNTYALIGTLNDGYKSDAWEKELVHDLLDEQTSMMDGYQEQLRTLLNSGFLSDPNDKKSVSDMIKAAEMLKEEAQALHNWLEDESAANETNYMDKRESAWQFIKELLQIED